MGLKSKKRHKIRQNEEMTFNNKNGDDNNGQPESPTLDSKQVGIKSFVESFLLPIQ